VVHLQVECGGYDDGNDSNSLRHDPMFRLGVGRKPFEPEDEPKPSFKHPKSSFSSFSQAIMQLLLGDQQVHSELLL
jgi:hypothetical protein